MSLEFWKAFFEIGGVALLAGSFIFGAGALIINNRINVVESKELADFKLKFEGEQQKTAHAQQEAAEAKVLAGSFERDIATANKGVAEANAKAEGFRLDIAKANEEAAQAKLELAKFKAPRTLSTGQQLRIANKVLPFAGQQFAPFVFADAESKAILELVAQSLVSAKWVMAEPKSDLRLGKAGITSQSGLLIQFSPGRSGDVGVAAEALAEALNAEGIEAVATPSPNELEATPSVINLIVGSKPIK